MSLKQALNKIRTVYFKSSKIIMPSIFQKIILAPYYGTLSEEVLGG